jgi:FixJ family two-component response regulator
MILDLELANTDGFWLSEKIRDLDDNIIIFFLIGSIRHSHEIITLFPIWAVSNFFDKPIIADQIIEQVLETIKNDQKALRNFKKWN